MTKIRYPIRAVARLTGLSLDTLRAWERRYHAVMPKRGQRGRLYTEHDLERLQLLREVVSQGHAIGQVARLGDQELRQFVEPRAQATKGVVTLSQARLGFPDVLGPLVQAIGKFDYAGVDLELSRLATLVRPGQLIHEVVLPLMRLVGKQFCSGRFNIAQEHMTSAILRNLLGSLVRTYTLRGAPVRLLFATPPGELHEFGILAGAMLAASSGLGVIYLGPNLPQSEIVSAVRQSSPQAVILGISAGGHVIHRAVRQLARKLDGKSELWLGGSHAAEVGAALRGRHVLVLESLQEFESQLKRLGGVS